MEQNAGLPTFCRFSPENATIWCRFLIGNSLRFFALGNVVGDPARREATNALVVAGLVLVSQTPSQYCSRFFLRVDGSIQSDRVGSRPDVGFDLKVNTIGCPLNRVSFRPVGRN